MADADELAEVARYTLRRMRILRQAYPRDERRQVPDHGVRSWRNRARPADSRRSAERHGRDGQHGLLLLLRKGRGIHLRDRASVRPQHAGMNAWLRFGQ